MSLAKKMGDAHERFLVSLLGGRKTKASGSVWKDQMDGRHNRRDVPFAFAWDGKSTLGKSVGVSRAMWEKAREQAAGERPLLALRFYDAERLDVGEDLVVLSAHDFAELLEEANHRPPLKIIILEAAPWEEPVTWTTRYGRKVLIWDDRFLELDRVKCLGNPAENPKLEVIYGGKPLDLPPDREIEVYAFDKLAYVVRPDRSGEA